jgi:hypothetical protein
MGRIGSSGTLVTKVELALLAGRNLEQVEAEVFGSCEPTIDRAATRDDASTRASRAWLAMTGRCPKSAAAAKVAGPTSRERSSRARRSNRPRVGGSRFRQRLKVRSMTDAKERR